MKSFDELNDGELVISPIDGQVMQFRVDSDGLKYLCSKLSWFPIHQFDPKDHFKYGGNVSVGEYDHEWNVKDV